MDDLAIPTIDGHKLRAHWSLGACSQESAGSLPLCSAWIFGMCLHVWRNVCMHLPCKLMHGHYWIAVARSQITNSRIKGKCQWKCWLYSAIYRHWIYHCFHHSSRLVVLCPSLPLFSIRFSFSVPPSPLLFPSFTVCMPILLHYMHANFDKNSSMHKYVFWNCAA